MTDYMTVEEFHEYQATGKLPKRHRQQTRSSVLATVADRDPELAGKAAQRTAISAFANESEFQADVIKAAIALGWKTYHTTYAIGSDRGYPDLTMCHPNHGVLWLELKGPKGRVADEQREWIESLQDAGQNAYIVFHDQWDMIEDLLNGKEVAQ